MTQKLLTIYENTATTTVCEGKVRICHPPQP